MILVIDISKTVPCRACGAPNPFRIVPVCQVCLAITMHQIHMLQEGD